MNDKKLIKKHSEQKKVPNTKSCFTPSVALKRNLIFKGFVRLQVQVVYWPIIAIHSTVILLPAPVGAHQWAREVFYAIVLLSSHKGITLNIRLEHIHQKKHPVNSLILVSLFAAHIFSPDT